jgi:hypothetical protein
MDSETYGLSVELLTELTNVHPDTARRWKRRRKIPKAYASLVDLHMTGDLGTLATDWKGFRLIAGRLWTPEGTSVTPGDIRAIPYRQQLVSEMERSLREPKQWRLF